ncbi:MAG: hypothetical protein D8M58_00635 [Calditrichaeota bacterium]|nr:MAG: hypothetical protein DWQ03_06445 [Calditrichota bacterium]MBL1203876.1 hypothetical protein [Calditrichota bacterium]NOG43708.1 hypothetical protein [Calditrichota bacterium]
MTGLKTIQKREELNITDSEPLYYIACDFALFGDKKRCIQTLQKAIDGGYFNYPAMLRQPDLDPVRDDPEFQKLMEKAKKKHLAFKKKFFPGN